MLITKSEKMFKVKKWHWIFFLLPLCISAAGHSSKYHTVSSLGGTEGGIKGGNPLHPEWVLPWQAECGVAAGWQDCDHISSPAEAAECRRWGENIQPEQPAGAGPEPMDSRVRGHMQGNPQCSTRTTYRNTSLQDHQHLLRWVSVTELCIGPEDGYRKVYNWKT